MIQSHFIIGEMKAENSRVKEERLALTQFSEQLDSAKHRRTVVSESKLGVKFLSLRSPDPLDNLQDTMLEAKIDEDTPVLIATDITGNSQEDFRFMPILYDSQALVFTLRD